MILASRGQRETDAGSEPVDDPLALAQIRCQAHRVHLHSIMTAAVLTALALALPPPD